MTSPSLRWIRRVPAPALDHLVLRCADIDVTRGFYERLGLVFETEQHGAGPAHHVTVLGGTVVELYPASDRRPPERGLRVGVAVDDVAAIVESLTEASATVDAEAEAIVDDPDGRVVVLVPRAGDDRPLSPVAASTDPASSTISVSDLRRTLVAVLDAVELTFGDTIRLDADHYWMVESTESFDVTRVPELVVGRLSDDLEALLEIDRVEIGHDLDHLIGVLRRIAAMDRPA